MWPVKENKSKMTILLTDKSRPCKTSGQISRSTFLEAAVDSRRTLNTEYANSDLELSRRIFRKSASCTRSSLTLQISVTHYAHRQNASVVIILIITADLTNSLPVPMVRTPHHFSNTVDCGINHNGKITHNFERNAPKSYKTGKKVIHKNAFKSSVKQYLISGRKNLTTETIRNFQ